MEKNFTVVSLIIALVMSGQVYAQNSKSNEFQIDKFKVETNRFWSNWYIKAGGGVQMYLGDNDSKAGLGKRLSPALDLSVGKWFTRSCDFSRNNEFAANIGFINRFRLSCRWDLNVEGSILLTKDNFDSQIGGSAAVNDRLSKERAEAVRTVLAEEFGVDATRLKVEYKGGVDNMYYDDATLSRAVLVD